MNTILERLDLDEAHKTYMRRLKEANSAFQDDLKSIGMDFSGNPKNNLDVISKKVENQYKSRMSDILKDDESNKSTAKVFKIYEADWEGWWNKVGMNGIRGIYEVVQTKPGGHLTGTAEAVILGETLLAKKTAGFDNNLCDYNLKFNPNMPGFQAYQGTYHCSLNGGPYGATFLVM